MKILFFSIAVLFISPNVLAVKTLDQIMSEVRESKRGDKPREHVVDPYRVERKKDRKIVRNKIKEACYKKNEKFGLRVECIKSGMNKWLAENPDRGTVEYGEKFYSKLTKPKAKDQLELLIKLMDYVSFTPKTFKDKDIELTVDLLHSETLYIQRYVLKINPKDYRPFK